MILYFSLVVGLHTGEHYLYVRQKTCFAKTTQQLGFAERCCLKACHFNRMANFCPGSFIGRVFSIPYFWRMLDRWVSSKKVFEWVNSR